MPETAPFEQQASDATTYPAPGTLNRLLFKTPLLWWRVGLGGLLGRSIIVLTTWGRKCHRPRQTTLSYTPMVDSSTPGRAGERAATGTATCRRSPRDPADSECRCHPLSWRAGCARPCPAGHR